jgi:hypothetical protein
MTGTTDLYRVGNNRFSWWSHRPGTGDYLKHNVLHIDGHTDTHKAYRYNGFNNNEAAGDWKRGTWSKSPYAYYDTDDDR